MQDACLCWALDDATYAASAAGFDNPDFVDTVIRSYRHRYALAVGDPAYDALERQLAAQPAIAVPSINLHGGDDGIGPAAASEGHAKHFTGPYARRVVPRIGHNVPQEAPEAFAAAVVELHEDKARGAAHGPR